jgi:hypothetical protein
MSLYRIRGENGHQVKDNTVPIDVYLADLKNERDCIISRLRHIDRVLIEYDIIKAETIPRRVR